MPSQWIRRLYPDGRVPSVGVVLTDLFMPVVMLLVLLILAAMPFLIWRAVQEDRRFTEACEVRGGTVLESWCVSEDGRIIGVTR